MPTAQQKFEAKCEKFFNQCNNGDPITPGQLARVIREANPSFQGSDQDIAQMFLAIDDDQDRLVTWEEFKEAIFAKPITEITRAELEEVFKEMDKDGSGKLTRDEVKGALQELELDTSSETLDKVMEEADPNGDGVDTKEFLGLFKDLNLA